MVPLLAVEFVTFVLDNPNEGELMLLVDTELVTVELVTVDVLKIWEKILEICLYARNEV